MKTGLVVIVVVMALVGIQTDTKRTLMEEVKKEKNDIITKEEVKIAAGTEVQDNSGTSGKTATGSADEKPTKKTTTVMGILATLWAPQPILIVFTQASAIKKLAKLLINRKEIKGSAVILKSMEINLV